MTTDDAPRPALDAVMVERLRARSTAGAAPRCRECGGEMFPDSEPHYDRAAQRLVRYWYCPIVYRAPGQPGMGGTLLHGRLGRDVVWEGDPDALALLAAYDAAAAERAASAARIARAQEACGDPGWANDLCECLSCQKVKAAYAAKHGAFRCERCGYEGPIGTISCQCYDYSCRGAGEDMRGTGCPHGCGTCPVCMDGERDAWEIVRAIRAALAPAAGEAGDDPPVFPPPRVHRTGVGQTAASGRRPPLVIDAPVGEGAGDGN